MKKKLIQITTFFVFVMCFMDISFSQTTNSQKAKRILIYTESKKGVSLTFIEKKLKQLHYRLDSESKYFEDVINLNHLADNLNDQQAVKSVAEKYQRRGKAKDIGKKADKLAEFIGAKLLNSQNLFLKVKIFSLNNFINFQFNLYPIVKDKKDDGEFTLAFNNVIDAAVKQEDLKLKLDSDDYERELVNALKRLFPETESPPISVISVNGIRSDINKVFYFQSGKEVILDAALSYDLDTQEENLKKEWKQINSSGNGFLPSEKIINFKKDFKKIIFRPISPGDYYFRLSVSDGVHTSKAKVHIRVINSSNTLQDTLQLYSYYGSKSKIKTKNHFIDKISKIDELKDIDKDKLEYVPLISGDYSLTKKGVRSEKVEIEVNKSRLHILNTSEGKHLINGYLKSEDNIIPSQSIMSNFTSKTMSIGLNFFYNGYIYEKASNAVNFGLGIDYEFYVLKYITIGFGNSFNLSPKVIPENLIDNGSSLENISSIPNAQIIQSSSNSLTLLTKPLASFPISLGLEYPFSDIMQTHLSREFMSIGLKATYILNDFTKIKFNLSDQSFESKSLSFFYIDVHFDIKLFTRYYLRFGAIPLIKNDEYNGLDSVFAFVGIRFK